MLEICYGDPDNLLLNQALAALYTNCNRHNEAMALYLKLQHHEVSASLNGTRGRVYITLAGTGDVKGMLTLAGDGSGPDFFT